MHWSCPVNKAEQPVHPGDLASLIGKCREPRRKARERKSRHLVFSASYADERLEQKAVKSLEEK
jgi:hypothetical protein